MQQIIEIVDTNGKQLSLNEFASMYLSHKPKYARWHIESIREKIRKAPAKDEVELKFLRFISLYFNAILTALPDRIEEIIKTVDNNFPKLLYKENKQTDFGKLIEEIFDYGGFRSSVKAKWLAKVLNIRTCLYCNAQSTLTVASGTSNKLLFQYDHFYSKTKYPFLSLSLFNLIPSCSNCNTAKSKKDFTLSNAYHPYASNIHYAFEIKLVNEDVLNYLITKEDEREIKIILNYQDLKVEMHDKVFGLTNIYNEHSDLIEELIMKVYYYNKSKQKEIFDTFKGIINTETVMRFILGNYFLDKDINNRPLAKMIKDISGQLKLL